MNSMKPTGEGEGWPEYIPGALVITGTMLLQLRGRKSRLLAVTGM